MNLLVVGLPLLGPERLVVSFYVFHLLVLKSWQVATRWPAAQVAGWADA